jgi:diaminopimelate decarboxylase
MFKNVLYENYQNKAFAIYASKALCCIAVCRIIKEEGLGLDVVSGGEIYTALKAGFPMQRVVFHGNNKSTEEIKLALDLSIGRIVVDNFEELRKIINLNKPCRILIRVRPCVEVSTHSAMKTGSENSKFGFSFGEAYEAVKIITKFKHIVFKGFHCHIGSQIFESEPFVKVAEIMMNFLSSVYEKLSIETDELNLGGGFGVRYTENQPNLNINEIISEVSQKIKQKAIRLGIKQPDIYIEPGRSITAEAGVTLYTVGAVKKAADKIYAIVDGSMADNPRFALYRSEYEVVNINGNNRNTEAKSITIAGKCCESGDIIAENVQMPIPKAGDILVVRCTGAYNFSMASNYNRLCRPALVMINKGEAKLAIKRQTYKDLLACEIDSQGSNL